MNLRFTLAALALLTAAAGLQGCEPQAASASMPASQSAVLARGTVDADGGLLIVAASRSGRIASVSTSLGQEVEQGAVLAQLADGPERAEVDIARAELQRAHADLAAARSKRVLLRDQVERVREAVRLGAESGRELDDLDLQLASDEAAVPVAEAAVESAEARLRGATLNADAGLVRSPAAGRIVQVNAHIGALAASSDTVPLFLLRPRGSLVVRASLAVRDAERVRAGMKVKVEDTSATGHSWTGRVREIGELARKPDSTQAADDFASERVVDCVIELDASPLRVGEVVLVRFGS